jgi:DNA repair protein RecN (Recombination protein N)
VIEYLRLAGLGVIDSAELELGRGLTVLTGETGAGKTMVVTGLGLLLGGRGGADLVRSGAAAAQVTAAVVCSAEVADRVGEVGGALDDGSLTLVRTVLASGRSRAAAGGAAVPVGTLAELGAAVAAIHGQSEQVHLVAPSRQRDLLDRYGALLPARDAVAADHAELSRLRREWEDLRSHRQQRTQEAELLRHGLAEVAAVEPQPGEDVALRAEEERLAHAVELTAAAGSVAALLSDDERSAANDLSSARRTLEGVGTHDSALAELAGRVGELGYLLNDVVSELNAYVAEVEADPVRLAEVQDRRAALGGLQRKYGPELADVLRWAEDAGRRVLEVDGTDARVVALGEQITETERRLGESAASLSHARSESAERLAGAVTSELGALSMPDAELVVVVAQREVADDDQSGLSLPDGRRVQSGASGIDEVTFQLKPHAGSTPLPLQKGASGGELSRVMLALEVVLADVDPVPTLVFDEVDAGVGGAAAVEVGRRLARLARSRQVLVVTHLPQVAAFADRHWVVSKSTSGEVTASDVHLLDDAGRVRELTRMLAGLADSSTGQAHAEELLEVARTSR